MEDLYFACKVIEVVAPAIFPLQDAKPDDAEGDASPPKPTRHRRAKGSKEPKEDDSEKVRGDRARLDSKFLM